MRIKSVNYWISQLSAEEKNSNAKEPQNDKDLNFQLAQYYITKEEQLKPKLVA